MIEAFVFHQVMGESMFENGMPATSHANVARLLVMEQQLRPFWHSVDINAILNCIESLGNTGWPEAIPYVVLFLANDQPAVRGKAAWAIAEIGLSNQYADIVFSLLDHPDSEVQLSVLDSMYSSRRSSVIVDRSFQRLVELLSHSDPRIITLTSIILTDAPPGALLAASVASSIGSPPPAVPGAIEQVLLAGEMISPILPEYNQTQCLGVRVALAIAATRCQRIGVNLLLRLLNDNSHAVREVAARGLGMLRCSLAISSLEDALGDPHESVRFRAAVALARIGHLPPKTILAISKQLDDISAFARRGAFIACRLLGEEAVACLPRIHAALSDDDEKVRDLARGAIVAIAPDATTQLPRTP